MAASDVRLLLGELWKIWLKTHDAGDDNEQAAQSLLASLRWWTQLIVENVAPIAAPGKKGDYFFYQKTTLNTWFKEPKHSEVRRGQINVINVNEKGQEVKCYTLPVDKFPQASPHHDYEVFYHGTRAKDAKCIIEDGIDLSKGKGKLDFSDGNGFYVTNKFAEVWPNTKWDLGKPPRPSCSTVLIYKIKKDDLRRSDLRGLDLTNNTNEVQEEWKEVVTTFRNGKATESYKQDFDYIEGPVCGDPKTAKCYYYPTKPVYQLCVRSERCAELFDRGLHSVIFFNK